MNLAKISKNGQITVPKEVRDSLNIKPGDKVLFTKNNKGEILIENPNVEALRRAQQEFRGLADKLGVRDEEDLQKLINEIRHGNDERLANLA